MEGLQGLEDLMISARRTKGEKHCTPAHISASKGQRALELRLQYLVTKMVHGEFTAEQGWLEHTKEERGRTQGKMAAAVTKALQAKSNDKPTNQSRAGARTGGRGSQGRRPTQLSTSTPLPGGKQKTGQKSTDGGNTGVSLTQKPAEIKCYNCSATGHMARDCSKPQKDKT